MYQFSLLTSSQAYYFEKLTYPTYRPLLKKLDNNPSIVAVGVNLESQSIGLGLATINQKEAEVLSLFIHPEHRKQGLGKNLLANLESELKDRECFKARIVYITNQTTSSFEKILQSLNWFTPQIRMLICEGTRESFKDSPLLTLNLPLPDTYTIFPWTNLTPEDRELILKQQAISPWYPDVLSPFTEEELIESSNSLGLRYKDRVVGWVITHRVANDTIRYTKLFIKKEFQSLGRAIPLLVTSIKLQIEKSEATKAVFTVIVDNIMMIKFINRRLAPYLSSIRHSWSVSKLF